MKEEYKIISYVLWGLCVLLSLFVCGGGVAPFILAVACGIAAYAFNQKASTAHAEEREELEHQKQVKELEFQIIKQGVREEQIEKEALLELELADLRRETEFKTEQVKQNGLELENQLIEIGKEQGLLPAAVSVVNEHKYRAKIALDTRWTEYQQDQLDATLVQLESLQLDDEITSKLFKAYEERKKLEAGSDLAKDDKLARLNKNIAAMEALLDTRQQQQLQAAGWKDAQTALPPYDPSGEHEEEESSDQEQVPAKRGRGRPRKNIPE